MLYCSLLAVSAGLDLHELPHRALQLPLLLLPAASRARLLLHIAETGPGHMGHGGQLLLYCTVLYRYCTVLYCGFLAPHTVLCFTFCPPAHCCGRWCAGRTFSASRLSSASRGSGGGGWWQRGYRHQGVHTFTLLWFNFLNLLLSLILKLWLMISGFPRSLDLGDLSFESDYLPPSCLAPPSWCWWWWWQRYGDSGCGAWPKWP